MTDLVDSLREAFFTFWETLWALVLGFGLSGIVQTEPVAFIRKPAGPSDHEHHH